VRFNVFQRHLFAKRFVVGSILASGLAAVVFLSGGCSRSDEKEDAVQPPAKIEAIEGMKYYVGGPVMKYDKYSRMRLAGFNGEVSNPTTRGLLLGFKKSDDGTFDYRTWLNGAIISQSNGFLDADGLLWYRERLSYDANGAVVVRQQFTYDDERKVMRSTLEHLDPVDKSVVKSVSEELAYTPPPPAEPAEAEEKDDGEDGEDGEDDDESGDDAAPKAAPAK
jgi:hypothetical protein